jgi:hypothetical protein
LEGWLALIVKEAVVVIEAMALVVIAIGTLVDPVEYIWQFLRQNYLANRVFDSYTAIVDACCDAWNTLVGAPDTIRSIAYREWAEAVIP